jgi:hypothetical protein
MTMTRTQSHDQEDQGDLVKIICVDYPYLTLDGTREFLGKLPVSEQDREKIAHLNAEKLFTLSCP